MIAIEQPNRKDMLDQLIISEASATDLMGILQLQCLAYHSEARRYSDFNIPPLKQTLSGLIEESGKSTILKATWKQKLVGSVRGLVEGKTCKIGRLIVDPKFQRQGIGSKLLNQIERSFPDVARFELFTGAESNDNISFYQKYGYREYKRRKLSDAVSLVFLEKKKNNELAIFFNGSSGNKRGILE